MKITAIVARYLTGFVFLVFGLNGFLHFIPAPPMAGLAAQFNDVFVQSHWLLVVSAVQVVCGVLLLVNQFAPLALVTLAAVLVNIFVFHITMAPQALPLPIVVTVLWFLAAWPLRAHFAPLLAQHATYAWPEPRKRRILSQTSARG